MSEFVHNFVRRNPKVFEEVYNTLLFLPKELANIITEYEEGYWICSICGDDVSCSLNRCKKHFWFGIDDDGRRMFTYAFDGGISLGNFSRKIYMNDHTKSGSQNVSSHLKRN